MKCPVLENVERLRTIVDEKSKDFLSAWYLFLVKKTLEIERKFPIDICLKNQKCGKISSCEEVINKIKKLANEIICRS